MQLSHFVWDIPVLEVHEPGKFVLDNSHACKSEKFNLVLYEWGIVSHSMWICILTGISCPIPLSWCCQLYTSFKFPTNMQSLLFIKYAYQSFKQVLRTQLLGKCLHVECRSQNEISSNKCIPGFIKFWGWQKGCFKYYVVLWALYFPIYLK